LPFQARLDPPYSVRHHEARLSVLAVQHGLDTFCDSAHVHAVGNGSFHACRALRHLASLFCAGRRNDLAFVYRNHAHRGRSGTACVGTLIQTNLKEQEQKEKNPSVLALSVRNIKIYVSMSSKRVRAARQKDDRA